MFAVSRYNDILINADLPLPELAQRLAELVGGQSALLEDLPEGAATWYELALDHEMVGRVTDEPALDDEPHVPWTAFRFLVVVEDPWRRGEQLQDAAARALYEKVVASTPWTTMLVLDDGAEVAASRGSLARSA